ncbi:AAA family ATPase [Coxiella-like endosymbiont]|uniref:AAA family ATPase n=1 Tax=Coxiella-like endosymbiont TaxID=1592897 RepID=UPI0034E2D8D6
MLAGSRSYTGVGKTKVICQLESALGIELIQFDMSEYMEHHTVSRLIGHPPLATLRWLGMIKKVCFLLRLSEKTTSCCFSDG